MITESICLRQEKDLVDNRTSLCSSIPLSLEGRYALLDKEWRKRYFYSDVIIGFTYNHDTLPSNCAQCPLGWDPGAKIVIYTEAKVIFPSVPHLDIEIFKEKKFETQKTFWKLI